MKYIIFETLNGLRVPIIFPDFIDHSDIRNQCPMYKPLSAGRIHYNNDETTLICTGESTTLRLKSLPEDEEFINRCLGKY